MRDSYTGGICDPNKATTCTKKNCYYKTGKYRDCRYTTRFEWISDKEKKKWLQK